MQGVLAAPLSLALSLLDVAAATVCTGRLVQYGLTHTAQLSPWVVDLYQPQYHKAAVCHTVWQAVGRGNWVALPQCICASVAPAGQNGEYTVTVSKLKFVNAAWKGAPNKVF